MLSATRQALEAFDNQHDFERLAADVLNGLGYADVEPMAPGGGADGGRDIRFREGDDAGLAFVTLEKRARDKFLRDLAKIPAASGVIAFFCKVDVTPATKVELTKEAISKGYRLEVLDLERLRSLLDSSLKDVRRRYLHLDDEPAAQLRAAVTRLLRFPDAVPAGSKPPTMLENLLVNKTPLRLFELLLQHDERVIGETPDMGEALHAHLTEYYAFRQRLSRFDNDLVGRIGSRVSVRFREAWLVYHRYATMRFAGRSKNQIMAGGDFLNYDITWEDAERVFQEVSADQAISDEMADLLATYSRFGQSLSRLLPPGGAGRSPRT